MAYDRPIKIEKYNQQKQQWEDYIKLLHAEVNKDTQKEEDSAGATRIKRKLKFKLRYCKPLADISDNTQLYRIRYKGVFYNIIDTDNYFERNQEMILIGVSY